ncbi:hypothetical protein ACWDG1_46150 [Streptomyces sp. NPDC001177]
MTEASWVSLVGHVMWPLVVLVLVLTLRRQIGGFLSAVGGRITQVSVMSVTIEFAVETETTPPWRGAGGEDVRGLVAAQNVNDSYFDTLRQSLEVPGHADYFIVDLKSDDRKEWLTSRLYLFTYLLSRMKGVRSVVFVATRGDVARYFLGVAESEELLRALAATQPWLRAAQLQAEADQVGPLPDPAEYSQPAPPNILVATPPNVSVSGDIDEWWQRTRVNSHPLYTDPLYIPRRFVELVQWAQPTGAADPEAGWLRLPDTPGRDGTWEHATWIAASDLLDGSLSDVVHAGDYVLDDRSWSAEERVRAVAQARGDAVALLDPDRRFDRLVDRRSLLEAVGRSAVEA